MKKTIKNLINKIFGHQDLNILETGVGILVVIVGAFVGLFVLKELFFWFLEQMFR